MSALTTLIRLELTRSRSFLIGSRHSKPYMNLIALVCIMGIVLYMMEKPTNANLFFFTSTVFFFEALFGFSFIQSIATVYGDHREWWMTYPQPRRTLVLAKFYALCIVGFIGVLYILVLTIGVYCIASLEHWIDPIAMSLLIRIIVANALLACASIPFVVGLSLLTLTLQVGWRKVIHALFLFIVFEGGIVGWGYATAAFRTNHDYTILMPSHIVEYCIAMIILGWTIAYFCILHTAKNLNRLGEVRYKTLFSQIHQKYGLSGDKHVRKYIRRSNLHPFWVLVLLEFTRFRWLGKHAPWYTRIILSGFTLVLAVGGYFAASSLEGLVEMPHFVLMMGYGGIAVYTMSSQNWEFQKGRGHWWLTYPHSRIVLLASRLIGQVSALMLYICFALFSTGVGFCLRLVLQPEMYRFVSLAVRYWESSALLCLVLIVCNVCIFQITPALYKTKGLRILLIPTCFSYFFGIQFISHWVMPEAHYELGPLQSFWGNLGLLIAIGFPAAVICFSFGVKYLNEYSNQQFQNRLMSKRSQ